MTPKLGLTQLVSAQNQPHIPLNENNIILDVMVAAGIKDRDLTAPPGAEANGDAYIPTTPATGVWVGKEDYIEVWADPEGTGGAWVEIAPQQGMVVYVQDEKQAIRYDGSSWQRAADLTYESAGTADTPVVRQRQRTTTGVAANGLGLQESVQIENANGDLENAVAIIDQFADVTDGAELAQRILQLNKSGVMVAVLTVNPNKFEIKGTWDSPLVMNNSALWVDATGDTRIKAAFATTPPTTDLDGTVLGTQV